MFLRGKWREQKISRNSHKKKERSKNLISLLFLFYLLVHLLSHLITAKEQITKKKDTPQVGEE